MKLFYAQTPKKIEAAAQIIRRCKLCFPNGGIRGWCKESDKIQCITLAKVEKNYVGCAVLLKEMDDNFTCNVGVYVIPTYRQMGIGKTLLNLLMEKNKNATILSQPGTAITFYRKCGLQ